MKKTDTFMALGSIITMCYIVYIFLNVHTIVPIKIGKDPEEYYIGQELLLALFFFLNFFALLYSIQERISSISILGMFKVPAALIIVALLVTGSILIGKA
jgi:hypothetical protein